MVIRVPRERVEVARRDQLAPRSTARGLNGGQSNWYFAPMRVGDVVTADVTLIDTFEKEGKVGTMMFLVDETRLTNQRGELVRITHRVSIYS